MGGNYLREHMIPKARIHYAVTNTGGDEPVTGTQVQPLLVFLVLFAMAPDQRLADINFISLLTDWPPVYILVTSK